MSTLCTALLPCPVLLLLAGCVPQARRTAVDQTQASGESTAAPTGQDAAASPQQALEAARQRNAELEQQLAQSTQQIADLQHEIDRLRAAAPEAPGAAPSAPETWGHTPATLPGTPAGAAPEGGNSSVETLIASLRQAAAREHQRRESAETELAHLKAETSGAAYDTARVPESDFLAVKQEVVDLRRELAQERNSREQLAAQLHALEQQPPGTAGDVPPSAGPPTAGPPTAENAELTARLKRLEADKQAIVESFDRSLAASQKRTAELEQQLATLQSGKTATQEPSAAGDTATIQAENAALRASLEEERKRTELLAAKLKAASRITDLIFKIRAQQSGPQAEPGAPEGRGAGKRTIEPEEVSPEELLPER